MTQPAATDPLDLDPTATYTDIINYYLGQWGLSSLSSMVQQLGQTGATSDQIALQIQNSDAYKQRFSGNQTRIANGLAALDPATYIAMEGSYQQVLSQLPNGFWDGKQYTDQLIGGNVSAQDLSNRVQDATNLYLNAPAESRQAFDTYYPNAGSGGAIASILDPTVAEPLLNQQLTAAGIGGSALSQGLQLTAQSKAMKAAQQGVTIQQAQQAYSQIAGRLQTDTSISGRFASPGQGPLNQDVEENATLLGDAGAIQQQNLLYSEEQGQFQGHGGADAQGQADNPGSNY